VTSSSVIAASRLLPPPLHNCSPNLSMCAAMIGLGGAVGVVSLSGVSVLRSYYVARKRRFVGPWLKAHEWRRTAQGTTYADRPNCISLLT
jgi:hypothetical protein